MPMQGIYDERAGGAFGVSLFAAGFTSTDASPETLCEIGSTDESAALLPPRRNTAAFGASRVTWSPGYLLLVRVDAVPKRRTYESLAIARVVLACVVHIFVDRFVVNDGAHSVETASTRPHPCFHLLAGLERHDPLAFDGYPLPCSRVPAHSCFSKLDLEHAEVSQFDPAFLNERVNERIKRSLDQLFSTQQGKIDLLCDPYDYVFFCHVFFSRSDQPIGDCPSQSSLSVA